MGNVDFDTLVAARTSSHNPTYATVFSLTPAANPTDVSYMGLNGENRSVMLRRVSVRATADVAGYVDAFLLFSASGLVGTPVSDAVMEPSQVAPFVGPTAQVLKWTTNPASLGGGRVTLAQGKLQVGTAAAPAPPLTFDFMDWDRPPTIRALSGATARQIALNFNGQAMPANTSLDISWLRSEASVRRKVFVGDSLISNAQTMFRLMNETPGVTGAIDIRNYGSNGKRLIDLLPTAAQNISGLTYDFTSIINAIPQLGASAVQDDVILHYLTNDVRTGATTLQQAISLIDAFLYIMKNGCTSGQTWVSSKSGGAGTAFTWNATLTARPQVRIWLYGPNSYLADDPTAAGSITSTGIFSGMTLAQASQAATDLVYNAYQAFVGDPRAAGVLQAQDYVSPTFGVGFGRVVKTGALNAAMLNQLHPGSLGEFIKAEQLAAIIAA